MMLSESAIKLASVTDTAHFYDFYREKEKNLNEEKNHIEIFEQK